MTSSARASLAKAPVLNGSIAPNPAHFSKGNATARVRSAPTRPYLPKTHPQAPRAVTHVFTVNETTDSVDANPGNGVCADAADMCSLRAAIQEADALDQPVTVTLPAGTYTLSIAPNDATTVPDDVTSGDLNVSDTGGVVVNATGATIQASGLGDRILEVAGGASLWLNGGSLAGGQALDASSHGGTDGGALSLADSTSAATLQGVTISGNSAPGDGGGIFNGGALWLTDSTVSGNSAAGLDGGGLANNNGAAQLLNDKFLSNTVNSGGASGAAAGGGIWNSGGAVTIDSGRIRKNSVLVGSNSSGEGGGLYADDETIVADVTIADNSIGAATAATNVGGQGGGVYDGYGLESITKSVIDHNTVTPNGTSSGQGGGIYDGAGLALSDSRVTYNTVTPGTSSTDLSAYGGGIFIEQGTEQITNSVIGHNSGISSGAARGEGGGIYNGAGLSIIGSMVDDNTAGIQNQSGGGGGAGGGIAEEGSNALVDATQIVGNQALGGTVGGFAGSGGGIMADDITSISDSTISSNHAAQDGGGMWSDDGQHLVADTISYNTAQEGAGLWNEWQAELVNSTVTANTTSGPNNDGGGVFERIGGTGSKVVLYSSTVARNAASVGSGLSVTAGQSGTSPSGFVLRDTIVGSNTGSAQCNLTDATLTSEGHNLSSDLTCGLAAAGDITGVSPRLALLQGNGGNVSTLGLTKNSPAIDAGSTCPAVDARGAPRPATGCDIGAYEQSGYHLVANNGTVYRYGDAGLFGDTRKLTLPKPIVGMANTVTGHGYWLVASNGHVYPFGDAKSYGPTTTLAKPIVGMDATPTGGGYWLVSSTGNVFNYGAAHFYGFASNVTSSAPVVGMTATPDGHGYWLVVSTGHVYPFGDAKSYGTTSTFAKPVVGIASTPDGLGYWLVTTDGHVHPYGDAHSYASVRTTLSKPAVGMVVTPDGLGYWMVTSDSRVFPFGDARSYGPFTTLVTPPIVGATGV